MRVWLHIRSRVTNTENINIRLGESNDSLILAPGDAILINKDMPWTGSIAEYDTLSQGVEWTEASIQQ
jgi:hypothetical protein